MPMSPPDSASPVEQGIPPDQERVSRLRAGDRSAFELVVREHAPRLFAVARRLLGRDEDARDAVSEGLLCALRKVSEYRAEASIGTWLHRIVVNAALMRLRKRRREEVPIEDLLPKFTQDGHHVDLPCRWPDEADLALSREELRAVVRRAIDRLPETHRTVLLLHDIQEIPSAELARTLGITRNALKIRLHRARQGLRTLLDVHFRRGVP